MSYTQERQTVVFDTECYRNYWSIGFRDTAGGRVKIFELYDGCELDRATLVKIFRNWRVVGFNSINYDMPMIALAMSGATNSQLKQANDEIFDEHIKLKPWQFYDKFGVSIPEFVDHIDLQSVSPGAAQWPSLKLYGGRMHSRKMQDLPFDPQALVTPDMRATLRQYLRNDLELTNDLYDELKPQLAIRAVMSERYGIDLRSKSDAQIGEAVMKQTVEQRDRKKIYKEQIVPGGFYYEPPSFIDFETPLLRNIFERIRNTKFVIRQDGYVQLPSIFKEQIFVGGRAYQMGIGGLHSHEKRQTVYANDKQEIQDRDVRGYYSNLIIGSLRYPKNMGPTYREVLIDLVKAREQDKVAFLVAEKRGDKVGAKDAKDRSESGKVATLGLFGKAGSPFSCIYAPKMLIQTTVTGQLAILMSIERTTQAGLNVISANTDGFVTVLPKSKHDEFDAIIFDWECDTGLLTEVTNYQSIHSRDVNNYFAITTDGKVKGKGIFTASGRGLPAAAGLKKNPDVDICGKAVVDFIKNDTAIERTIRTCADVRQFVRIRREKSGAGYVSTVDKTLSQDYVGKAVRWYYANGERGNFFSLDSGKLVADTTGARPLMELPDELPDDLDVDWYVREAYARLYDVGVDCPNPSFIGRSGYVLANRPGQKTTHKVDMSTGIALCGTELKERRDVWEEYDEIPAGGRYCSKCRREEEL